jgi:hypothetical protein
MEGRRHWRLDERMVVLGLLMACLTNAICLYHYL